VSYLPLDKVIDLNFGAGERREFWELVKLVNGSETHDAQNFLTEFPDSSSPVWMRYSTAIYNHPKTWWIGLIQLAMLSGAWGDRHRRSAATRQSILAQTIQRYFSSRSHSKKLADADRIIRYCFTHHKADILGRLHGGVFTNYAATGGAFSRRLSGTVTIPAAAVNFTIASFGACIEAVSKGYRSYGSLAQSILIGRPKYFPEGELNKSSFPPPVNDSEISNEALLSKVVAIYQINNFYSGPIPISEFCSRPENRNLRRLCD
jgi:hypothetical protein